MVEKDFGSILKRAIKGTLNNPVLIAAGFLTSLLAAPGLLIYGQLNYDLKSIASLYSTFIYYIVILPFFTGGMLGYALEYTKTGSSSVSTFLKSAVKNYLKLAMAGVISFIVFYVCMLLVVLLPVIALGMGEGFLFLVLSLLSYVIFFVIVMLIEFYDIDIVEKGSGIIDSYKNSIALVRANLIPAILFFTIVIVAKILVTLPSYSAILPGMMAEYSNMTIDGVNGSVNTTLNSTLNSTIDVASNASLSLDLPSIATDALLGIILLQVVIQTVVFAFVAVYKSEFYLAHKDGAVAATKKKKITDFDYDFSEEEKKS